MATTNSLDMNSVSVASTGVSWGAILAGAAAAAALALILLLLGTGLGFASASPWANDGASAKALGISAIVWMIFVHLSSSAIGGYMAGRLRTKWSDVRSTEVFFRDTAHGLTAWAVGVIITAAFLGSAATSIVGGAGKAVATTAGAAAAGAGAAVGNGAQQGAAELHGYLIDGLFRTDASRDTAEAPSSQEVTRILNNALRQGDLPVADRTYLAQAIAKKTGISPEQADKRVQEMMTQAKMAEAKAKEVADAARKAAASLALASFLALLIGAFTASYTATLGGRLRDRAVAA